MKILDEIHTYQRRLDFKELVKKVQAMILRSNVSISQATRRIPITMLVKKRISITTSKTSDTRFLSSRAS